MSAINPEFAEEDFRYSFESVNYNHKPKLKSVKLEKENFKKVIKVFEVLKELEKQKWKEIPTSRFLYSGDQANPIKEVREEEVKNIIRNAFAGNAIDYSDEAKYYPSYLSVTREIRLFGYQWKGVFNIVLVDLNHTIYNR